MGKYNDIWIRVKEYDKAEKERKRKQRAEKRKQLEERRHEMTVPIVEDVSLIDESVRGEDEDTLPLWATTDYRVVSPWRLRNRECRARSSTTWTKRQRAVCFIPSLWAHPISTARRRI